MDGNIMVANRKEFLEQVKTLRDEGKSIRAIAAELNAYKSRVQRALIALAETGGGRIQVRPDVRPHRRHADAAFGVPRGEAGGSQTGRSQLSGSPAEQFHRG